MVPVALNSSLLRDLPRNMELGLRISCTGSLTLESGTGTGSNQDPLPSSAAIRTDS